jgi:KUP system potassium uptake protein
MLLVIPADDPVAVEVFVRGIGLSCAILVGSDQSFSGANLIKVVEGGWAPLLIALLIIGVMFTWVSSSGQLAEKARKGEVPLDVISNKMAKGPATLVPGTS